MTPPRLFILCDKRVLGGLFAVDQGLFRNPVILLFQRLDCLLHRMNKMV